MGRGGGRGMLLLRAAPCPASSFPTWGIAVSPRIALPLPALLQVYPPNPELGLWVKRQRVARAASQLTPERLQVLDRMGFEWGDLAQVRMQDGEGG
jgi:hypothetical protein